MTATPAADMADLSGWALAALRVALLDEQAGCTTTPEQMTDHAALVAIGLLAIDGDHLVLTDDGRKIAEASFR